jgi:putative hydrolase of the HAD superfamily
LAGAAGLFRRRRIIVTATRIRAVCFDVGGVLTGPVGPAFAAAARASGLPGQEMRDAMLATFASDGDGDVPTHRLERGEITLEEFFASLDGLEHTVRVLMDPASPHFVPAGFSAHQGMHALVAQARRMGMHTGVISNVVKEWLPWWEQFSPPADQFDVIVHSCEVGLRKPNAAIYKLALEQLGVEASETLYLDDFPAMVDAAADLGMVAVLVQDHDTAIAAAQEHLHAHL